MLHPLIRWWQRWRDDTRFLYTVVLVKAAFVVLLFFVLWAFREQDVVVVYMRF